jgi:predicted SAM-dependent methyltransferase
MDAVCQLRKLNLGCSSYKKEGFINVDFRSDVQPEVVHDLNVIPYPFEESSVDLIEADHVLEHLDRPFEVMKELYRILKPGGELVVKVPHFSRGFTHAEHAHGFDVTFPWYFDRSLPNSFLYGPPFELLEMHMRWSAFGYLLKQLKIAKWKVVGLRILDEIFSFLANLGPFFCSRIWCFWVGGFEEIQFRFRCEK